MNAKEARQLTDEAKAIEALGFVFQRVKEAAKRRESAVYLQNDAITQTDRNVLEKLGYRVTQRTETDDFDRKKAYDWEILW